MGTTPSGEPHIEIPGGRWEEFEREYRLVAPLQKGRSNTKIYRAVRRSGVAVAVKISSPCIGNEKVWRYNEAIILASSRHPRLVQYVGHVEDGTRFALAMELCHGDLLDAINICGMPPYHQIRSEFAEIVSGVAYLHSIGIAHLDIKPENILRTQRGWVLADFEFAKSFANGERIRNSQGTIYYAAPELLQPEPFSVEMAPIDIYALGALLYVMSVHAVPFEGEDNRDIRRAILSGIYDLPEWIPPEISYIISFCMDMNPARRPSAALLTVRLA